MSWDQFLVENGFGHTEYWPPSISNSRQKRRKSFVSESSTLNLGAISKEINDSQHALSKNLGANMVEGNPM